MKDFNNHLLESTSESQNGVIITIAFQPELYQKYIYCNGFNLLQIKELAQHKYIKVAEGHLCIDFSNPSFSSWIYRYAAIEDYAIALARYIKERNDCKVEVFKNDANHTPIPVLF